MTRQWPVAGVALAALWLFVRGVSKPVHVGEEFIIGLGVGLPIAYVTRNLYVDTVSVARGLRSIPYAVVYLVNFLWELVTANLEVAYRVLAPSMPIHPDVVEVPLRVRSDLAITTIANSITLTPGTLTMDYDPDRNALYVHTISGQDREAVLTPIRRWEDLALVIFDEDLSPGAPVPDPDADAGDEEADDDSVTEEGGDSGTGTGDEGPESGDGGTPENGRGGDTGTREHGGGSVAGGTVDPDPDDSAGASDGGETDG